MQTTHRFALTLASRALAELLASWPSLALSALLLLPACGAPHAALPANGAPFVVVLGTAQDGGLPQLGCRRPCCQAARTDPGRARRVASLAIVDPLGGGRWLIDATPDLTAQVALLDSIAPPGAVADGRPPLFDAVFLTHAHMGHVGGLVQLGREAYAAQGQPVLASAALVQVLSTEGPWRLAVQQGHLRPEVLAPDSPRVLARAADGTPSLTLTALSVPHRAELSDTLAYLIEGPSRRLLYLPDIDRWEAWDLSLVELLGSLDLALVDGTFFSADELPDRVQGDVPHPLVLHTLELVPTDLRGRLLFTHLNHSNPAADPRSAATARVRAAGSDVAREGQIIGL